MRYLVLLSVFLLSACFDDLTEINAHIEKVKASTPNKIKPMPTLTEFQHFDYSAFALRSPFVAPKPEAIQEKMQQMRFQMFKKNLNLSVHKLKNLKLKLIETGKRSLSLLG